MREKFRQLIAVLSGGFCGTMARYWLSQLMQFYLGKSWPYDILLINITGTFLLAWIITLVEAKLFISRTLRLFLCVGFLGAYTTFSSFALGDVQLATAGHWLSALLYLFASLAGGIIAILCGSIVGRLFLAACGRIDLA